MDFYQPYSQKILAIDLQPRGDVMKKIGFVLCFLSTCQMLYADVLSGEMDVRIYDYFEEQRTVYSYSIKPDGNAQRSYELVMSDDESKHLRTGDVVEVSGQIVAEDMFLVDSLLMKERAEDITPVPSGDTIAFIMVDLNDAKISDSYSPSQISAQMSNVQARFNKLSFGQFSFTLDANNDGQNDVIGPLAVDESKDTCNSGSWGSKAIALATQQGIDMSQYKYRVFLVSGIDCGWAGVANLGCSINCSAFLIDPTIFDLYAHELGHNFGLHHANTDVNDDDVVEEEYGDLSCPMGWNYYVHKLYNGPHMAHMGWKQVTPMTIGQNFKVSALHIDEQNAAYPQVVSSFRDDRYDYYISFRQPKGEDGALPNEYAKGISIHSANKTTKTPSRLIKVLAPGESFKGFNLEINNVEIDGDTATIWLEPFCESTPEIYLNPSLLVIDDQGHAHGTLVVKNNDDDGCAASTYDLTGILDQELSIQFDNPEPSLLPKEKKEIGFVIKTPQPMSKLESFTISLGERDNDPILVHGKVWLGLGLPPLSLGITTDVYQGRFSLVPDFSTITPIANLNSPYVTLGSYSEGNNFAMLFQGFIRLEQDGLYTFYLSSDDGSWLNIDEERLIDNDGLHGNQEKSGKRFLAAGYHFFQLGYFERSGLAILKLSYELPGVFPKEEVPALNFTYIDYDNHNSPPVVDLGPDQLIPKTPYHKLYAEVSDADEGDSISSYLWEKVSGPDVVMHQDQSFLELEQLQIGIYRFRLTATDQAQASGFDEIEITVRHSNQPPIADAGPDRSMSMASDVSLVLMGIGHDPDGVISGYSWQVLSDPINKNRYDEHNSMVQEYSHTFIPWIVGQYVLRFTVVDNDHALAHDDVVITVGD